MSVQFQEIPKEKPSKIGEQYLELLGDDKLNTYDSLRTAAELIFNDKGFVGTVKNTMEELRKKGYLEVRGKIKSYRGVMTVQGENYYNMYLKGGRK